MRRDPDAADKTGADRAPLGKATAIAIRFGPALALAAGLAWALSSGVLHHLSLHDLRDSRFQLQAFVRGHPVEALGGYALVYIAVVSCCLPGALLMTLTGGFLFGPWLGGATADLACSAGATVVFVLCRLATGDSLERRAHPRFKAFEEGFRKDAFLYLLTLRLIPVTPSWLVNLAAGVIGLPLGRYVAATAIGFVPASFIYAGLGSGLGGMFERGEQLGPQMLLTPRIIGPLIGLALLSILPIAHHWLRARESAKIAQP